MTRILTGIVWFCLTYSCFAQTGQFKEVELDITSKTTLQPVPFDEPFIIKGKIPGATSVSISYFEDDTEIPFSGTADSEGNFKIFFNRLIDPKGGKKENPGKYPLKVTYSRKIPPESIAAKKGQIISKIEDYLRRKREQIERRDVIDADLVRDIQADFKALVVAAPGETIVPSPGTIFDPGLTDAALPDVIDFVADLFDNVQEWSSRVKEVKTAIQTNPAFGTGGDFDRLLNSPDLATISFDTTDRAVQQFARNLLANGGRSIKCIAGGGRFNPDGSSVNCEIDLFDGTDPLILFRKTENYLQNVRSLNSLSLIFQRKGFASSAGLASSVARTLDVLARQPANLKRLLESRQHLLAQVTDALIFSASTTVTITGGFSDGTLQTRSMFYISLDAGAFVAPVIDEVLPYVGVNLYFRPVKKATSFQSLRTRYNSLFWHRFAAVVGFTPTSLQRTDRINTDVFLGRAVVTGVGYRVTEFLRAGAGVLWIRQKDVNPLVNEYNRVATLYFSLSIDLDVLQLFSSQIK